ncbi:MAG: hypothetical protein K8H89_13815 [Flavobacteriales bacterium]|jgi:hypothetical protein|nr:hypothetical protein [Flavobacteriales bacterium]
MKNSLLLPILCCPQVSPEAGAGISKSLRQKHAAFRVESTVILNDGLLLLVALRQGLVAPQV